MNSTATFDCISQCAVFCAELVKNGIVFRMETVGSSFRVTMTGY